MGRGYMYLVDFITWLGLGRGKDYYYFVATFLFFFFGLVLFE